MLAIETTLLYLQSLFQLVIKYSLTVLILADGISKTTRYLRRGNSWFNVVCTESRRWRVLLTRQFCCDNLIISLSLVISHYHHIYPVCRGCNIIYFFREVKVARPFLPFSARLHGPSTCMRNKCGTYCNMRANWCSTTWKVSIKSIRPKPESNQWHKSGAATYTDWAMSSSLQNVVFKQGIILYIHYNLYSRIQYNMIFGSYRLYLKSNKQILLRNVLTVRAVSIRLI